MNYIQKNLLEGEKIMYSARQHGILYVWAALIALIGIGQFVAAMVVQPDYNWLVVHGIIMLVMIAIAAINAVNTYGGRQYLVTNRRLICKRGIIRRESLELLLRKCEGVKIEQSIMGRLLNYGTVIVTTGEATNVFKYIDNPIRFSAQINQQIDNLKLMG